MTSTDMDIQAAQESLASTDNVDLRSKITALFERWMMDPPEQMVLLGLSWESSALRMEYERGGPTINGHILVRFGLLKAIHDNLQIMFPRSKELAYTWMHEANEQLEGQSPMEIIHLKGLPGLVMVSEELERAVEEIGTNR